MIIKSIEALVQEMLNYSDGYVLYAGFYEDVKELLENLIRHDMDIESVVLEPEEYEGYADEYYLIISELGVSVEKAKWDTSYKGDSPDVLFINKECNKEILSKIEAFTVYVDLNEEPIRCEDCPERFECPDYDGTPMDVHIDKDEKGNIHSVKINKNTENEKFNFEYHSSLPIDEDVFDYLLSWF